MPLQLVWLGVREHLLTIRKVFLLGVGALAIFYVFFAFAGIDRAREQVGPTPAQREEARRLAMYESYDPRNDPVDDEDATFGRTMTRAFMCRVTGELCTPDPAEAHLYKKDSITYAVSGLLASPLRHPPSSFYYWARNTLENAGFVPKTYAQGIGFAALTSFQPIWKVFRNLAYLIIVVVVVVVGFMVMFRVGGGGKNAVTLESALPKLVVALLAISMSYAVAGLLIDVMYLSIALVVNLLGHEAGMNMGQEIQMIAGVITGMPQNLFKDLLGNVGQTDTSYWSLAGSLYSLVPGFMQTAIDTVLTSGLIGLIGEWKLPIAKKPTSVPGEPNKPPDFKSIYTYISSKIREGLGKTALVKKFTEKFAVGGGDPVGASLVGTIISVALGLAIASLFHSFVVQSLLTLLLILGMVVVIYRLFFMLIGNYIEIILSILTAPLALMLEAIPGQNAALNWVRGLAVNLTVYPVTLAIILLARAITNVQTNSSPMWAPPFVVQLTDQSSLQAIIAGVIIFSIPNIVKTYKQKLKPASAIDSMGVGLGSLFIGASPIFKGGGTILNASGLSTAMARRITKPLQGLAGEAAHQTVRVIQDKPATS